MAAMASELGRDGFTNRCLVFHDTTIEPDEDKIGDLTSKYHMSVLPIHKVFAMFFDWLPERMTPAEEIKTSKMIRGKTVEQGAGKWVHPRSEFLLREEPTGEGKPYRSVLQGFKMRKEMKAHTIRMRKHYLPILAIPFESKENLKSGVISLLALEKADKLLVAFWYAACRFQLLIPNDWNDVKVKIISEKLKQLDSEEITGGRLRKKTQGAGTKNDREWKELLMHGMSIGAWTVTEKNKNGNPTLCIKPNYALGLSARQTLANPPANPLLYREYILYKGGGLPLSSSKDDQDNELILLYGGGLPQNPTSPNLNDDVVSGLQQENGFAESGKPPKPPEPFGEFEF